MMKERDFDHIVKQKLEAISEAPPAYMWDRVATGIAAQGAGIATSTKVLLIAASVVFLIGLTAIFFSPDKTTKRNAIHHFKKPQFEQQIIKTHQINSGIAKENSNASTKIENSSTSIAHTSLKQQSQKASSNDLATQTPDENSKGKTSNKRQNTLATNNQKEVFPPLPSTTEIRKAGVQSSASANKLAEETKKEDAQSTDASYKVAIKKTPVATILPSKQIDNLKEPAVVKQSEIVNNQANTQKETKATAETKINTEQNIDTLSAIEQVTVITGGLPDDIVRDPSNGQVTTQDPKNRALNKYGIGIHYGPEFMDVDGIKLSDQGIDLSFNYQNLNFIVQTGLGVRFSEDQVTYDMGYRGYWKSQVRFDSLVLTMDENGNIIPTPVNQYYEKLYDTSEQSYKSTATEQYTILQIPLLVGYQKDFKNFAIYVKGGIRYSIIVNKNTQNLTIPGEQPPLILDFNYPKRTRTQSNIDYELSLGGVYKMTKHFQIHAEVLGRYYHYSIYEENPPSGIHPWSTSIRAGLIYIF